MVSVIGREHAADVRRIALDIYRFAAEHALARQIIIADTKFEFGVDKAGRLMLIDEALTPDSSRFWPTASYRPGSVRRASTSNSCAIIWNRCTGTRSRRHRICRRTF